MRMKLRFLGAARNVTGSRHLLEANGLRILVDCGLYQERQFRDRNWEPFVVPPAQIDAVLLTHAHLDHCGLLPKLVREGFKGRIHCTEATAELAKIILLDSAKLQVEDAEYKKKRHKKEGRTSPRPIEPLYTTTDVEATFPHFSPIRYGQPITLGQGLRACFCDAGHVLGSSIIKVTAENADSKRSVVFSGDIGRANRPIIQDPDFFQQADYVLVESTYGDRVHHDTADVKGRIAEVINAARKARGRIVVPSFALERSQELLFYINELRLEKLIPKMRVYLDSPMAAAITKVFSRHPELYDRQMSERMKNGQSPFNFPGLNIVESTRQSKQLNPLRGTFMIIAGSGMCTGGRIKHHLVNSIANPRDTIMFVGYQAAGTLGRTILDRPSEVRILGQTHPVRARIEQIHGFSAHADREEIFAWLSKLRQPPRKIFLVHGEAEAAEAFGGFLRERGGWEVAVPEYQQTFELN